MQLCTYVGDSEGSNMVGILEAFIGMRGSMGSIGTGNPVFQMNSASPLYTTVFQTPSSQPTSCGVSQQPEIKRCQQLRQEAGQPTCRNFESQQQNQQHNPTSQNPQANKRHIKENDLESKDKNDHISHQKEKDIEQLRRYENSRCKFVMLRNMIVTLLVERYCIE